MAGIYAVKPAGGQAAKFALKLSTGHDGAAPIVAEQIDAMAGVFYAAAQRHQDALIRTKGVLNAEGVSVLLYGPYCAASLQLSHAVAALAGDALAAEAAVIIATWTSRGLAADVLETIRTQVWNIAAPVEV